MDFVLMFLNLLLAKLPLNFLGYQLSKKGIQSLPHNVKCIVDFPKPTTLTQLRRFWEMLNFYQTFLPKAAHILAPLIQLLKGRKNTKKPKKKKKISGLFTKSDRPINLE